MVNADSGSPPDTPARLTQCQVHQLLECQRRVRRGNDARDAAQSVAAEQDRVRRLRPSDAEGQRQIRSRLMSKKQLQDMAVGVKELSKRLGSVRQKLNVRTVFLLTKKYDESLVGKTRELVEWLLKAEKDRPYTVWVLPPQCASEGIGRGLGADVPAATLKILWSAAGFSTRRAFSRRTLHIVSGYCSGITMCAGIGRRLSTSW